MPLFHVKLIRTSERIVAADTKADAVQHAKDDAAWEDFSNPDCYDLNSVAEVLDPEQYAPRSEHPRCRIWEPKNPNNGEHYAPPEVSSLEQT